MPFTLLSHIARPLRPVSRLRALLLAARTQDITERALAEIEAREVEREALVTWLRRRGWPV